MFHRVCQDPDAPGNPAPVLQEALFRRVAHTTIELGTQTAHNRTRELRLKTHLMNEASLVVTCVDPAIFQKIKRQQRLAKETHSLLSLFDTPVGHEFLFIFVGHTSVYGCLCAFLLVQSFVQGLCPMYVLSARRDTEIFFD